MFSKKYFVLSVLIFPVFFASLFGDIKIDNVKLRLIKAEKFVRISEYFTGVENKGSREIFRTNPAERGGLYFILDLSDSVQRLSVNSSFVVDLYHSGSSQLKTFIFELTETPNDVDNVFLGITQSEESKKVLPIAWRIQIRDSEDQIIAEKKSYLWELPEE